MGNNNDGSAMGGLNSFLNAYSKATTAQEKKKKKKPSDYDTDNDGDSEDDDSDGDGQ